MQLIHFANTTSHGRQIDALRNRASNVAASFCKSLKQHITYCVNCHVRCCSTKGAFVVPRPPCFLRKNSYSNSRRHPRMVVIFDVACVGCLFCVLVKGTSIYCLVCFFCDVKSVYINITQSHSVFFGLSIIHNYSF